MTITALPPAPSTNDPSTFDSKADALIAALPTFVTETNAVAVAMNLNSTTDTSASSVLIGTGAKTFTVTAGKSFQPGMYIVCADTAAPSTNSVFGQVTSYSGTTLVINVTAVAGSGTKTAWVISQSAGGASGFAALAGATTQDFAAKNLTLGAGSLIESEGAAVTAASSTNIWAGDGNTVHVTGNTGIADFATAPQAGAWMKIIFDGTPLLTQSANLNLNAGGANIQIAAGDFALVYADTTTQMDVFVMKKDGFSSSAENVAGTVENKAVDPLGIREAFNCTGSAPVYACRAWVSFNGVGTVAIHANGNVNSITDNGVGDYTINFTTALPDANYVVAGSSSDNNGGTTPTVVWLRNQVTAPTTAAVRIGTQMTSNSTADPAYVNVAIFR